MKRTGCPDRSCPRELRAKGAGVQYVHRFDHTCRIVSFPVGNVMISGSRIAGRFAFARGGRAVSRLRVYGDFVRRLPCPGLRFAPALRHSTPRSGTQTGFLLPHRSAPAAQDPSAARPRVRLPAPAASFAQRARLCAESARVPGPGPSRPCSPIFAVRRAFCHCIFFPVRFDLPCVPDRRTKNSGGNFFAAFALFFNICENRI